MSTVDITTEQLDAIIDEALPGYIERGLRTGAADMSAVKDVITKWYAQEGHPAPRFQRAASPKAAEEVVQKETGKSGYVGAWLWGSQDIDWLARYELARDRLGVEFDPQDNEYLNDLLEIAGSAGWIYLMENLVVVCDCPVAIHTIPGPDGFPIYHREGGKAVEFSDGWGLSYLWNMVVPDWLAEGRAEDLDPKKIMRIKNVDHRRAGIRRVGIGRVLGHMNAAEVDKDTITTTCPTTGKPVDHPYRLLGVTLPEADNETRALEMVYPSGPSAGAILLEFVPPWIESCFEARAWRQLGSNSEEDFRMDLRTKGYQDPTVLT